MRRREGFGNSRISGKNPAPGRAGIDRRLQSRHNRLDLVLGIPPERTDLPAQAVVQCQRRVDAPTVLRVGADVHSARVEELLGCLNIGRRRPDQEISEIAARLRAVELEASVRRIRIALVDFGVMELAAQFDGMVAAQKRDVVQPLQDAVVDPGLPLRSSDGPIVSRDVGYGVQSGNHSNNAQRIRAGHETKRCERDTDPACVAIAERRIAQVIEAEFIDHRRAERLHIAQVQLLRTQPGVGVEAGDVGGRIGIIDQRLIEEVVAGDHPDARIRVAARAPFVVAQRVVECRGRVRRQPFECAIGAGKQFQQRSDRRRKGRRRNPGVRKYTVRRARAARNVVRLCRGHGITQSSRENLRPRGAFHRVGERVGNSG